MRRIYFILFLLTVSGITFGQNERKFVRNGNKLFMEAVRDTMRVDTVKYSNAETEYRKALEKRPEDLKWNYNLADALYKQQKFEDAEGKFSELAEKMEEPVDRARVNHNLGNTQLMQEKLDESIESYKKALRENPDDLETKYNLAYAQMLKKQKEQQQQQNKDQNKDQNNDKNKDQNQDQNQDKNDQNKDDQGQNKDQNKDQQDQNKDQNQQNQDQNKDQNKDQQQQQQPQQNKISKQDAEQLLQALQNDERDIQDKVKKAKAAKAKRTRSEKEW